LEQGFWWGREFCKFLFYIYIILYYIIIERGKKGFVPAFQRFCEMNPKMKNGKVARYGF
jgi:hypothetical protein